MLRPGEPWDSPHESPMHYRLAPRRYRAGGKFRTRHGRATAGRGSSAQAENCHSRSAGRLTLAYGEIRGETQCSSGEPAMRGWSADRGNYAAPVAIGSVMRALGAGVVIESRDNDFTVGDAVAGWFGWQEEAVVRADAMVRRIAETRSEEHTSALQSLMRISYAVFCLKKKNKQK